MAENSFHHIAGAIYEGSPVLSMEIQAAWEENEQKDSEGLANFLQTFTSVVVSSTRYKDLVKNCEAAMDRAQKIKFSPSKYYLPSELPSLLEVKKVYERLYLDVATQNEFREELVHYLHVLKKEMNRLQGMVNALKQFTLSSRTCTEFKGVADRERHFQMYAVDLLYTQAEFKSTLEDLSLTLEAVISRIFALARIDSSLKVLARIQDQDNFINGMESRPKTTSPVVEEDFNPTVPVSSGDFSIEVHGG